MVAQLVKSLPAAQETWVQFLGQEDPLEKEMAPTPGFLPGESHGQRSLVGYSPWSCKELVTTEHLFTYSLHTHLFYHLAAFLTSIQIIDFSLVLQLYEV